MPGQRGTERRRLSGHVVIRLAPGTAALVAARAVAAGLTQAAWVRGQLVGLLGADPVDAVPERARRAPRPPAPAHVLELARLRESVAELAGVLVQAAIRSREGERLDTHAVIEAALPDVRRAVRDLDALKQVFLAEDAVS